MLLLTLLLIFAHATSIQHYPLSLSRANNMIDRLTQRNMFCLQALRRLILKGRVSRPMECHQLPTRLQLPLPHLLPRHLLLLQIHHLMRRMQGPRRWMQTPQVPLSQGALTSQAAAHPAHLLVVRSRGRHSLHSLLRLLALLRRMKVTPLSTCHPQSPLTDLCAVCVESLQTAALYDTAWYKKTGGTRTWQYWQHMLLDVFWLTEVSQARRNSQTHKQLVVAELL